MNDRKLGSLQVATILENFLSGTGGRWDLDDFISVAEIADERLREIQQHVNLLSEEFPPTMPGVCQGVGFLQRSTLESSRLLPSDDNTSCTLCSVFFGAPMSGDRIALSGIC